MSMNEIDNTPDTDLDSFSAEFFGQNQQTEDVPVETPVEEEVVAVEETTPEEDTQIQETENDEPDESDPEPKEAPKKKTSYQERINELTAARREAERREIALQSELAEIKRMLAENNKPKQETPKVEDSRPAPDAINEDGTDKYPLGEFDPEYIADLTMYQANKLFAQKEAERAEQSARQQAEEQTKSLRTEWDNRIASAAERHEDYAEKSSQLISSLSHLDPVYSDQLATTLMSLNNGPDVLYYLANNPTEAFNIINSGPINAAISFGRIDSRFEVAQEQKEARPRVSKAPPPPVTNKGSAASLPISDDTDNLDAFEKKFFKR
jgi:hypothetical protein